MVIEKLDQFLKIAEQRETRRIVVAAADDDHVLSAVRDAVKERIVKPTFVGDPKNIVKIAQQIGFDNIENFEIVEEGNRSKACKMAVRMIRDGKADIIMKGLVPTADFLRAVLSKDEGLRTGNLLSHVGFFDPPAYHKCLAITDCAQNVAPTLQDKIGIINNTIDLFHRLGVETPKVAMLAAVEVVNPKMEATIDAAAITQMNRRGQIKGCIIDGPFAFDNAVSAEAAHHKGMISDISGDVDMLLVPDIEAGNILYKSLTYLAGSSVAAMILGAAVPIVLTSRADSDRSKLMSIALAASY